MTESGPEIVDALRASLKETDRLRRENRRLRTEATEPIAIVGLGCRFPGPADTADALWDLLRTGTDTAAAFPQDRGWDLPALYHPDPDHPGTTYVNQGNFLSGITDFDAEFFGISPREALAMDPQQRLLLEVAWETLEHARIDPHTLRGSSTGVYLGIATSEYVCDLAHPPREIEGHALTGNTLSVASGRIAYVLGLEGPAVSIDTACSSSLVSLHLAVQALRNHECTLALAGGVSLYASPAAFVELARQRALAADGRCKAFAADADGFGPAEGLGLLALERLFDAQQHGRRILAVIRGSAVNQDGASSGLTAPNGPAQERVIRRALRNAGVQASEVDAVEAHGTGTPLGDPIEAQALIATYGQDRPTGRPLRLGSIKSNIGHTTAAAGVAGVIKMVLALRAGLLPKTLHVDEPSPKIDWDDEKIRLLTEPVAWPPADRPRRAAVSSFGISGTNAHLILEEAPPAPTPSTTDPAGPGWLLSARSRTALAAQAGRLEQYLDAHPDADPNAIGTALRRRCSLPQRAVLLGSDAGPLRAGLRALARAERTPQLVTGVARSSSTAAVFVYPGQGGQWAGMGADLLPLFPAFAESMADCDAALFPYTGWHVLDVVCRRPNAPDLGRVDVVQPALWAVMISLTRLWQSAGVQPATVIGHSQGEIAAAHIAGALTLDDSARIIALRSAAIRAVSGAGGMASLAVGPRQAADLLRDHPGVGVAAINSPTSVVLSGGSEELRELLADADEQGLRTRVLPVDYASHSVQIEPLRDRLLADLADLAPATGVRLPFCSTVTGAVLDPERLATAEYWYENLRSTVRFEDATVTVLGDGFRTFVEPSPHPTLTPAIQETADAADLALTTLGTLRRDEPGPEQLALGLARAWTAGQPVFAAPAPGSDEPDLPGYPFQRQRFWLEPGGPEQPLGEDAEFWTAVRTDDPQLLAKTLDADGEEVQAALRVLTPLLAAWHTGRSERAKLDSWRYHLTWKPLPRNPDPSLTRGTWLLAVPAANPAHPWAAACRQAIADHGGEPLSLTVEAEPDRAALADRLRGIPDLVAVVSLLGLDSTAPPQWPALTAGLSASSVLACAVSDTGIPAPIWFLTQQAVRTGPEDRVDDPRQAGIWGLGKTLAVENPALWGGQLDLPGAPDDAARALVATALAGTRDPADREDQLAIRSSGLLARRLTQAPLAGTAPVRDWVPRGTVLVTGGTGALGSLLAHRLAERGAAHLLLLNHTGPDGPAAGRLLRELAEAHPQTRVTIAACDLGDPVRLAEVLASCPPDQPLRAVFHAAGVADGGMLDELTSRQFDAVLRPKATGAWNLHQLTRELDLDAFVLYSSCAGVLPAITEANYAAANAYLDGLAGYRRGLRLPATSVVWGVWDGGGIGGESLAGWLREGGVRAMDPPSALTGLEQILDRDEELVVLADLDWERFAEFSAPNVPPIVRDLPLVRQALRRSAPIAPAAEHLPELRATLNAAARGRWELILLDTVCIEAAAALGHRNGDAIDPEQQFRDSGFDSLTGVALRNRINELTGLKVPSTLVFDHPTPRALARHLGELLGAEAVPAVGQEIETDPPRDAFEHSETVSTISPADLETATDEELFHLIDLIDKDLGPA